MRRNQQDQDARKEQLFQHHLGRLGLSSTEDYLDWCSKHGFARRIHKHGNQRQRELAFSRDAAARLTLQSKKKESRNTLAVLKAICEGRLKQKDISQSHLLRFSQAISDSGGSRMQRPTNKQALARLIEHVYRRRAKFFDGSQAYSELGYQQGNSYLEALVLVASCCEYWLRPVEEWSPTTKNARRQFASLMRHLFARYDDVPRFFDRVWFDNRSKEKAVQRGWYLQVADGKSIRKCRLPIQFTKKMAHYFMQAPDDLSVPQAIRWGQVHALGGEERLARTLFGTRIGDSFDQEVFWSTVIQWFIANPMLDNAHVGPIVDYLHHQRFVPEPVFAALGVREEAVPPQPNLTMRGRTPETLLRQVHQWHGRLSNDNSYLVQQWAASGIAAFEFEEGTKEGHNLKVWTIRELLGSKALAIEGRQLRHCVATYASSCAKGTCSIWTMEVETFEGKTKVLTIEVHHNTRSICQARGKLNRLATVKEKAIISRWAAKVGLRVANYI